MQRRQQLSQYSALLRLDKPIGTLLLLWPTLWALWIAGSGRPTFSHVVLFVLGVILMRAAGCAINDVADRHVDQYVARTSDRPVTAGHISPQSALFVAGSLALCAFLLVLCLGNLLMIELAIVGALLTLAYPFLKRITHMPQLGLGLAFAWGVPMAFAAERGTVTADAWILFGACVVWAVAYDTIYAMVDRLDDLKVGIKSSAILFASHDRSMIALLQLTFIILLFWVGQEYQLQLSYYIGLCIAVVFCVYQQYLIYKRKEASCFAAFRNNHWIGVVIFIGILASYY